MRKTLLQLATVIGLMSIILLALPAASVFAQVLSLPDAGKYNLPAPEKGDAVTQAKSILDLILKNARIIIGIIAIFMIVLAGFFMVYAQGNSEEYQKQRKAIGSIILGLLFIGFSIEVGRIFALEGGGFLKDPKTILERTGLFNNFIKIIVLFIKFLLGGLAVFKIIQAAMTLISVGGNEEKVTESRNNIMWSLIALVFIIVTDTAVNKILFRVDRSKLPGQAGSDATFGVGRAIDEFVGATNFILTIVGPVVMLLFVAGGILYVTSRGEESQTEKAKKIITAAVIGCVIIYGSFGLVSTLISGRFG